GRATIVDAGVDRVAHPLAPALDEVPGGAIEQLRRRVAHIAGRAQALLEQRELVIEAVRIEVAVRLAQAHGEAPALPRAQLLLRLRQHRVLVKALVPAERDERRQGDRLALRQRLLDL